MSWSRLSKLIFLIIFMRCLGTRAEPVWNQPAAPALMEQASEAGELVAQVDDLTET